MPTMNRPMAEMLAAPVASFIAHQRPDLNLNAAVVAAELTKSPTPYAVTMQAAWKLAGDLAARAGAHKTFAGLAEVATSLMISTHLPPPAPVAQFKPLNPPALQPFNPRREARCEWHAESARRNCSACRAEWLAGDITQTEYQQRQAA